MTEHQLQRALLLIGYELIWLIITTALLVSNLLYTVLVGDGNISDVWLICTIVTILLYMHLKHLVRSSKLRYYL